MPHPPIHVSCYQPRASRSKRSTVVLATLVMALVWTSAFVPSVPTEAASSGPGDDVGPASPGPDLNASDGYIQFSPGSLLHSQSATVSVKVSNTGDSLCLGVTVELYLGDSSTGKLVDSWTTQNITNGAYQVLTTTWTAVFGDHTFNAYLDTGGDVTEDDETNNVITTSISVGGIPDGRLDEGAFLLSSNMEGTITLTADAFNDGNATASGYKLGFYNGNPASGGTLIGRRDLANVPAGGWVTAQQSWTATTGYHHLYARLENTHALDPASDHVVDREVAVKGTTSAVAGPDQSTFAGGDLVFNGSSSSSTKGAIVNYTWDMGDGTTLYGAVVTHNYTNTGSSVRTVTVRLTVRDSTGGTDSETVRVYVNPVGTNPPTADAGTAPSGSTLETLLFNASGSSGSISTYTWDWGDGTTGTGMSPTHKYWDDGTYTVSLVVTSSDSLADADTITVTVTNRHPSVAAIPDMTPDLGAPQAMLAMATELDGYITGYAWDFGDGSTSTSRSPTHTWTSDGDHRCSLNVTDDDGAFTLVPFWVNVTNEPPAASFTVTTPRNEGQTITVDGRATTEPGGDIALWEWDWESDGTYDNTTGPVSTTVYYRPGWYNITLRVTDGEGTSNTTKREVRINNVVPTARASLSSRTPMEGMEVSVDMSASTEPGDGIVRYYVDWDWDQTPGAEYDENSTSPAMNHTYFSVGRFYLRVMVEDEDGSTDDYYSSWSFRVDVSNAVPLVNASESSGMEGENITVTVDAYEPGNDLTDFYWDFDRDGVIDAHTNVSYVQHIWWESGIHWVWVNVTDEDHMNPNPSWGAGEIMVNVTDVAPKPGVDDGQANEGEPTPFTVWMRGTEQNISKYFFDLDGDGKYDVESSTATTYLTLTERGDNGQVKVNVMVVDTDGTEGTTSFTVFVHDVAPTVGGPSLLLAMEGQPMDVEVWASEPGDDIVSYGWDWNADGIVDDTTSGPEASHVYNRPGAFRLVVRVTDEDGSVGSMGIQVLVANAPPEADAGTPPQTQEGAAIELNASGSSEPGGHIVSYEWDYDGDGVFDYTTREPAHWHAWSSPGVFNVVLRVTDADGTFDEDMTTVAVLDVEPVASLTVQVQPEDRPSLLDASGSYDPGGITLYEWNVTSTGLRYDVATTAPTLAYTFDRKVRYEITLTVTDGEGSKHQISHVVDIADVRTLAPKVTWSAPDVVMEGMTFNLRAWIDDPFPDDPDLIAARNIECTWDMGDGSPVRRGLQVTHTYLRAAASPYEVWLTVIDEDEDRVTIMVANITVLNPPPDISPVDPITLKAGGTGETTVDATDATTAQDKLVFQLGASAPDWVTLTGNKLGAEPGKGVSAATYMVTVRVSDELGATSTTQVPVVVTASEEATEAVGFGSVLSIALVFMLVAVVLAVIISTRLLRPGGGAAKEGPSKSEYDALYGEPTRRKARAVAKVEPEKVDVDYGAGEAASSSYEPPVHRATPAPEFGVDGSYEAPQVTESLPSWMTSSEESAPSAGEVSGMEREMQPPPPAPSEWVAPKEKAPVQSFKYRKPPQGGEVRYKGAGRPK